LRRQVDALKTLKMQEMKAAGIEYDQRMEELEKIEHPKPNADFIYSTFNEFASVHPWIGQENIRPKSIAREMFETFQSFHDYIKEYDLHRIEGLLLRYLSEVYKVLVQTVPETTRTDDVISMIEYFGEMLKSIDSSLIDEWENMRHPELIAQKTAAKLQKEELEKATLLAKEAAERLRRSKIAGIKNEVFRVVRFLANRDYDSAAGVFGVSSGEIESRMKEYYSDHQKILMDQKARSPHFSQHTQKSETLWSVEQKLVDPDGHNDWTLHLEMELGSEGAHRVILVKLINLGVD